MMSPSDNELLYRVGHGTPMGELFRRFWLPALLASELLEPDCTPRRLRILGEDLVAFRDSGGQVGVIAAYCPHKLAPLFFGRNEDSGLRCVYHGWKFDVNGICTDIPNLPPTFNSSALKDKAKLVSYVTREAGGVIWIFMGPQDKAPELPGLEWALAPAENVHTARWLQQSNWAQGMEGEIDSSHISFLHREFVPSWSIGKQVVQVTARIPPGIVDGAPVMKLKETDYGFVYGARRNTESGDYYWRVTQWFLPMFSMIPNDAFPRTGRAWVPVDDDHVMVFTYGYRADRPYTCEETAYMDAGHTFPPPLKEAAHQLPNGYVIDTWVPQANKGNDYLIDRAMQKTVNFTGIGAITDQDRALQENMPSGFGLGPGRVVDRSREMLVPSDMPVITARRMLIKMAKDLQKGIEPELPWQSTRFRVRSTSAISPEAEFDDFLKAHEEEMRATL